MLNVATIDSLMVRVEREKVQILDDRLLVQYVHYYPELGAMDDPDDRGSYHNAKPFVYIENGVTYRIYLKHFVGGKSGSREYVVFQISAKMLKKRYFEGITADNYRSIIDDINNLGVIRVTPDVFLNGLVSDIDICINYLLDVKSLKQTLSVIQSSALPGKAKLLYPFGQETNIGMDFNKREKATNSAPYIKIYHKGLELLNKKTSIPFYKAYLEPMKSSIIDNLVRYEFTINAAKHKKHLCEKGFQAEFKTFFDLLKCPQKELGRIARSGLANYIEAVVRSKSNEKLSPTDTILQHYIVNLVALGWDLDQLLTAVTHLDNKVDRSRWKSKIKYLTQQALHGQKELETKLKINERGNKFLRELGVNM